MDTFGYNTYRITPRYRLAEEETLHLIDKGTVRNSQKHNATCVKNRKKRKKRK